MLNRVQCYSEDLPANSSFLQFQGSRRNQIYLKIWPQHKAFFPCWKLYQKGPMTPTYTDFRWQKSIYGSDSIFHGKQWVFELATECRAGTSLLLRFLQFTACFSQQSLNYMLSSWLLLRSADSFQSCDNFFNCSKFSFLVNATGINSIYICGAAMFSHFSFTLN